MSNRGYTTSNFYITLNDRRQHMGGENTEYGADQIQILEGLEAVRKRPGMYIGSTSS